MNFFNFSNLLCLKAIHRGSLSLKKYYSTLNSWKINLGIGRSQPPARGLVLIYHAHIYTYILYLRENLPERGARSRARSAERGPARARSAERGPRPPPPPPAAATATAATTAAATAAASAATTAVALAATMFLP